MKRVWTILYFLTLLLEIYFGENDMRTGVVATKPLLMPLLAAMVLLERPLNRAYDFIIALTFAWLGDIFLMFSGTTFFLLGLGSFLLMQLTYIRVFYSRVKWNLAAIFGLTAYSAVFYVYYLQDYLPSGMQLPVMAYMLVITGMGIVLNSVAADLKTRLLLSSGSVLFIISDSLIAYNKFYEPLAHPTLWIMATYGIAQYLITSGYLRIFGGKVITEK